MEPTEIKELLEQQFKNLGSRLQKDAADRELKGMQQVHDLERGVDRADSKAAESLAHNKIIFKYIDDLKPLLPRLDAIINRLELVAKQNDDHEKRLRIMESRSKSCEDHCVKTKDQEDRLRKVEEQLGQLIGALKTWGPLVSGGLLILGVASLLVAVFK